MKWIGIVGSRRRASREDLKIVSEALAKVYESGDMIVSGGCPQGADAFAERLARNAGIPIMIYPANWNLGRHAGFLRNSYIAEQADVLIACVSEDRTGGTEDTIKKFEAMGKGPVILC